jgi:hypothetical protein
MAVAIILGTADKCDFPEMNLLLLLFWELKISVTFLK